MPLQNLFSSENHYSKVFFKAARHIILNENMLIFFCWFYFWNVLFIWKFTIEILPTNHSIQFTVANLTENILCTFPIWLSLVIKKITHDNTNQFMSLGRQSWMFLTILLSISFAYLWKTQRPSADIIFKAWWNSVCMYDKILWPICGKALKKHVLNKKFKTSHFL